MNPLGIWMYQAVLDETVCMYLKQFITAQIPSRNQNFELYKKLEVRRARWLFHRAQYIVECMSKEKVLFAHMQYKQWPNISDSIPTLPYCYEIHIQLGQSKSHQFYLTPAEFSAITLINSDIGRWIGDALDGPKPHHDEVDS